MILSLISVKITVRIKMEESVSKNVIFVAYSFMFTIKRTLVSLFYIYLYFLVYF